jgi:hypothetical protein
MLNRVRGKKFPNDMKEYRVYFIIRVYAKIKDNNGFGASMQAK